MAEDALQKAIELRDNDYALFAERILQIVQSKSPFTL